jgi:hypothetical protein
MMEWQGTFNNVMAENLYNNIYKHGCILPTIMNILLGLGWIYFIVKITIK